MFSETDLLARLSELLKTRLPDTWQVQIDKEVRYPADPRLIVDGRLSIFTPGGDEVTFWVEVRAKLDPYQIPMVVERLEPFDPGARLVVAPYLGSRAREELKQRRINYVDQTGNIWIESGSLFIHTSGANKDPQPDDHPLRSLKGAGAGRAIRALCDFRPPYGIRQLAAHSGAAASALSRVAGLLERDALLARAKDGSILETKWEGILRRWAKDYQLFRNGSYGRFLEPRGLNELMIKLKDLERSQQWALTGSLAASQFDPVAAPRLGVVYVPDVGFGGQALRLVPTESGANVILVKPFDPVVFSRLWKEADPKRYVAPTQAVVDLLVSPGRGTEEAEAVLAWMHLHPKEWQRECPVK